MQDGQARTKLAAAEVAADAAESASEEEGEKPSEDDAEKEVEEEEPDDDRAPDTTTCYGASGLRKRLRAWTSNDLKSCRKLRVQFLQALVDELERRFPRQELAAMKQFSVAFDPSLWPVPKAAVGAIDVGTYGLLELQELHVRFAARLGSWENLRLEYSQLLPLLQRAFQTTIKGRVPTVQDVMSELVKPDRSVSFPYCSHLLAIALVLPVATAECERGFSTMKRIKTALRNRMSGTKLLSLMVISIQGVDTQNMTFRPAVETWFGLRTRLIKVGKSFLQHWHTMEPVNSTIVRQSKSAAAKTKRNRRRGHQIYCSSPLPRLRA